MGSKALESTSADIRSPAKAVPYLEYEGLTFAAEGDLLAFLGERGSARLFPWLFLLPQIVTPLIAAMSFGLLGGCIQVLKQLVKDKKLPGDLCFVSCPVFGALTGLIVYFLALFLPLTFMSGGRPTRPEAIIAVSGLAGIFYDHVYNWMEVQIKKIFPLTKSR